MENLGNKYALAALRDRRATVASEINTCEKRLVYLRDALAHIDGTLHLMDPSRDPQAIPAKKPYRRVKLFAQGELNRLILNALRTAAGKPLGTHEIVGAILTTLGHDESARGALTHRVRSNLQYLHRERGLVEKHATGRQTTWTLKAEAA